LIEGASVIRGVIFDIDGVLEYQGKPYPGAAETVEELRARGLAVRFLTNSTLKSRSSAIEKLRKHGFRVKEGEMVTSSYATACYLREAKPGPCWVMLAREGRDEFKDIPQDEEHPACIVVGDYRDRFTFHNLNRAFRLLKGGTRLVGMMDELVDASLGPLELNVGAWLRMLEMASGTQAEIIIGKPYPYAINLTLKTMNVPRETVVMVGDRVNSDIAGARGEGLRSVLVKTGEFKPEDLNGSVQPDYAIDSIDQLVSAIQDELG
jgi:HAD superfamily hydrolase (TIGR01458 family)